MMEEHQLNELRELLREAPMCPRITPWEQEFITTMRRRVENHGADVYISDKMREVLKKIEAKVYRP